MHVDLITNVWGAGYQECVGRITINYPGQADSGRTVLEVLPQVYHGSYFFATEPHDDKDCLFEDIGSRVGMVQVHVEGEYRLPSVPSREAVTPPRQPRHLASTRGEVELSQSSRQLMPRRRWC